MTLKITIRIEDELIAQNVKVYIDRPEHIDDIRISDALDQLRASAERIIRDRLKGCRLRWPELAPLTIPRRA